MSTEPERKSRPKRVSRAPDPTALGRVEEAGRATGSALLGASVPVVGDGFGEFMGGFFPSIRKRREDAWVEKLRSAVNWLLRNSLRMEDLKDNEQFHDIVCAATEAARRAHDDEKRQALHNAIVNAGLPDAPSQTKQHMFVRLVDELDIPHLMLLGLMADVATFLKARGLTVPGPASNRLIEMDATTQHESPRSLLSITSNVLRNDIPSDLQDIVFQDLVRRGLVDSRTTFSTLCVGRCLASALGREFLRFISAPDSPAEA